MTEITQVITMTDGVTDAEYIDLDNNEANGPELKVQNGKWWIDIRYCLYLAATIATAITAYGVVR